MQIFKVFNTLKNMKSIFSNHIVIFMPCCFIKYNTSTFYFEVSVVYLMKFWCYKNPVKLALF